MDTNWIKNDSDLDMFTYLERESKPLPEVVLSFVKEFASSSETKKVYVPFAHCEEIPELTRMTANVDYYNPNRRITDFIREKTNISSKKIESTNATYDLVFSDLPFGGVSGHPLQFDIVEQTIKNTTVDGYAIYTFDNGITQNKKGIAWLSKLETLGLFVNAIIDLPSYSYSPYTMVESKIVVFSRHDREKVFLGKISKETNISQLTDAIVKYDPTVWVKKCGGFFAKGIYMDYGDYYNKRRIHSIYDNMSKNFKGEILSLGSVTTQIEAPKKDGFKDEVLGAVYISRLGQSSVVTQIADFDIKGQNYFRIIPDQSKIIPEFLSFVLNTDNGKELRVRSMKGSSIQFLNAKSLSEICVPVPDLKFQTELLKLNSELTQIVDDANRLKNKLHNTPAAYKSIQKEIKEINNRGDRFEQWIESLPYPLATILKRYNVTDENKQKQELLLYFFEAYAIFESSILVAAYGTEIGKKVEDVDSEHFEKSSFGAWAHLDQSISKSIRDMYGSSEGLDKALEMFHTEDSSLIKTLSNRDVCANLFKACDYRNGWKGHSGISGEETFSEHVRLLNDLLMELWKNIDNVYEKIQLVRQVKINYKKGEYINTVELLTGSNGFFKRQEYVGIPLDADKLYIHVIDTDSILELPPFVLMKSFPKEVKNACYFYNRIEGQRTKYVSYHFESMPEDFEDGCVAYDVIKRFLS